MTVTSSTVQLKTKYRNKQKIENKYIYLQTKELKEYIVNIRCLLPLITNLKVWICQNNLIVLTLVYKWKML